MTDLDNKVAELREKYEEPMRKYVAAEKMLDNAYWRSTDIDEKTKLFELSMKLFPFGVGLAASCALKKLEHFDDDKYGVWKNSFVNWVEVWIEGMKTVEI